MDVQGRYTKAVVFSDEVESTALRQIQELCDQPFTAGATVRVMPDVHAGAGCVIGLTMTLPHGVVAEMVGVDIGCGVLVCPLGRAPLDLAKLDRLVRRRVPYGHEVHDQRQPMDASLAPELLRCARFVDVDRAHRSLGTLGGGNHFISVEVADDGEQYLLVHTGSRHLGLQVAEHYTDVGERRGGEGGTRFPLLEGPAMQDYLADMARVQAFAFENRLRIARTLREGLGLDPGDNAADFTSVHNYIGTLNDAPLLRKGAIAAPRGAPLVIPLNMRDGSILGVGRGNPDWNESAPHGAGRRMSRHQARRTIDLGAFTASMRGIYSTSVSRDTLDEAPDAYKPADAILARIGETVTGIRRIRPIYNFKAKE